MSNQPAISPNSPTLAAQEIGEGEGERSDPDEPSMAVEMLTNGSLVMRFRREDNLSWRLATRTRSD